MRIILLFLSFVTLGLAQEFYAKLEPIESYKVKAAVSGKVIYTNDKIEGKKASNSLIVELDSKLNKIDLSQTRKKLSLVNKMIKIENNNFNRLNKVSSKSAFEKDSQRLKVINLQSQKEDLITKIETLKDTISNKKLVDKSNYIFDITVKKGDYVNPGTLLYESKDIKKAKLEFYVPISSIDEIKNKTIYLDGEKTALKINRIYNIADSTHISSYKVKIVLANKNKFSRLIKIEFK